MRDRIKGSMRDISEHWSSVWAKDGSVIVTKSEDKRQPWEGWCCLLATGEMLEIPSAWAIVSALKKLSVYWGKCTETETGIHHPKQHDEIVTRVIWPAPWNLSLLQTNLITAWCSVNIWYIHVGWFYWLIQIYSACDFCSGTLKRRLLQ